MKLGKHTAKENVGVGKVLSPLGPSSHNQNILIC